MRDRIQLLLVGLPLFLAFTDIFNLFATQPPPRHAGGNIHHDHHRRRPHPAADKTLDFPSQQQNGFGAIGVGHTVSIDFCSSCSYRGTAVAMKNMLETQFPGIYVALANYPPSPPKRMLSKLVPVVQIGIIISTVAGDQIFPRLGISPPPWYYQLCTNRFGTISAVWLFGNFLQSFLQSSGAFEVYCDGELAFSKLNQQRFPGEIELRDLIGKKLSGSTIMDGQEGAVWS